MEIDVYFELYGKKMKASVKANSYYEAMEAIKNKIVFHKLELKKEKPIQDNVSDKKRKEIDPAVQELLNIFGIK